MLLKLIAAITMLLDHIGFYFYQWLPYDLYFTLRAVGRIAFPIYAFFIALGYRRTKHLTRYFIRILGLAVISEVVFHWAHKLAGFDLPNSNILFTFTAALGFLSGYTLLTNSWRDRVARLEPLTDAGSSRKQDYYQLKFTPGEISLHPLLGMILGIAAMIVSITASVYLKSDYGIYGIITVFFFYLVLAKHKDDTSLTNMLNNSLAAMTVLNIGALLVYHYLLKLPAEYNYIQLLSILSVFIIFSPKTGREALFGKKPPAWQQYLWYFFYPAHVLLLCLLVYFLR